MAQTMRESNKIIAIAPDTAETRAFRDWWCEQNPGFPASELWPDKMPSLEYLNVPNLCKYIQMMESSEAMDDYLATENIGYNPSIPDIFVGIVFDEYPFVPTSRPSLYDLERQEELDLHDSLQPAGRAGAVHRRRVVSLLSVDLQNDERLPQANVIHRTLFLRSCEHSSLRLAGESARRLRTHDHCAQSISAGLSIDPEVHRPISDQPETEHHTHRLASTITCARELLVDEYCGGG